MKQITIVHQNNALHIAGVKDSGEIIEPELTESLQTLIFQLIEALDGIKTPEEELQEQVKDYLKDTAPDELLIQLISFWKNWEEYIGRTLPTGELVVYEGLLYRCTRELDVLAHYPPPLVPTHYSAVGHPPTENPDEPKTYPQWTQQGWELGAIVWNFDRLWENVLEGQVNTWEPGTPGIDERYWVDVTERELGDGD